MKQTTITGKTRSRLDVIYAHELEEGDVFCLSNSQIKRGELNTVTRNELEQDGFGNWMGYLSYKTRKYSSKDGMAIQHEKTFKPGQAKTNVIFIRKATTSVIYH